ncbi:hypothetical protein [Aeromonas dhakensis]|uniref:hypothetical protein n=1 Tax=Aeromonas dhakensis TaxID=196024 RepID=UPI0018A6E9AB|nr:hypothetical protein [Aeromonas dhakensis]MBF8452009.1 hypothetical protein [Aeromonas dhakensis]
MLKKDLTSINMDVSYQYEFLDNKVGVFHAVNGIVDSSDHLYSFKKCLAAFSLYISMYEKLHMLKWLSHSIAKLDEDDYLLLSTWCNNAYKPLCKYLKAGIHIGGNAVEIANIFRWGIGSIRKDIDLAKHLLEVNYPFDSVVSNPSKFHINAVYAHSNMLSHYYFEVSLSKAERSYYARTSMVLLNHLLGTETALKNRANYMLSMAYNVLGEFEKASSHFIDALLSEHSLPFQKNIIIRLIFDLLPEEKLPNKIEKALTDGNRVLNAIFWSELSEHIHCSEIKSKMKRYSAVLCDKNCIGSDSHSLNISEIRDLNFYIDAVYTVNYCHDDIRIGDLLSIAIANDTPKIAKKIIFQRLAYSLLNVNKYSAMYYASMSLYHKYDIDVAIFIQRILLGFDYNSVVGALTFRREGNHDLAAIDAANSLNKVVWIDGDPSKEIEILEYVIKASDSPIAIDLAKIRASFLYIKGECTMNMSLGIQNFKKGDDYLESLTIKDADNIRNGVRDHGFYRHQKSLIKKSEDGEFVFIEKKGCDKLIIVFSCRYTYNVFQAGPRFIEGLETNALLINNPSCNWYSDEEDARVSRLIDKYALSRFERKNIFCHNASMGGYAAMKFAIKHKLLCLATNPQFNLNFWSFARPDDADRILSCKEIINHDKTSPDEIKGLKASIIIGRHPHDVLPFQAWLDNAIKASDFTYIITKHDIPEHDALMYRAYGDSFMKVIYKEFESLQEVVQLRGRLTECDFDGVVKVQNDINSSVSGRWVIHNENGKYFTA